jgi:hypothetical protein
LAKLWELAEHGGCDMILEVRQGSEPASGFWLNLTEEQYRKTEEIVTLIDK